MQRHHVNGGPPISPSTTGKRAGSSLNKQSLSFGDRGAVHLKLGTKLCQRLVFAKGSQSNLGLEFRTQFPALLLGNG